MADPQDRVSQLFAEALTRSVADRAAFLREACAGDEGLHSEVASLLAHASDPLSILEAPLGSLAAAALPASGASLIGRTVGGYQIRSELGAGGMGEVYRAHDTKLGRDVAIKILPRVFTADRDRLARFEREARMLAALNHPHIGAIYGLEEADGERALVLELVDGETLADRVRRGPVPVAEALTIARQIAEALDAAHEKGIIHRDLKPANIKIRTDGEVKVLDFGLAKLADPPGAERSAIATASPIITMPALTTAGVLLGTAAYMSPEQAAGQPADRRSDLWAFGVVLMEMLTGRRVFGGETVSHVLASVLKDEPDWPRLPAATPTSIRRLLRRCLNKDPKHRLDSAAAARLEIEDAGRTAADEPAAPTVSRRRERVAWIAAAMLAMVTIILAVRGLRTPVAVPGRVQRFSLLSPADATVNRDYVALSPDARFVAFVAISADGHSLLWIRSLDGLSSRPLSGTDDARSPFWSPDSRFIAFFAEHKLKKIQVAGGAVQTVCAVPYGLGGAWSSDGVIVFSPDSVTPLNRVSANGGVASAATTLDTARGERAHSAPAFLPDGRHFLYVAQTDRKRTILVGSIDSMTSQPLIDADSMALYGRGGQSNEHAGFLLFVRDGALLAQPFDAVHLKVTGDPIPVSNEEIQVAEAGATAPFSVSEGGVLAYRGGTADTELVWYDRSGKRVGTAGASALYNTVELSPDGRRLALERRDRRTGASDVWLMDASNGLSSQFTFMGGVQPRWSRDGRTLSFQRGTEIRRKAVDGNGAEELLFEAAERDGDFAALADWSPDERTFVIRVVPWTGGSAAGSLWRLPAVARARPQPIAQPELRGFNGRFSPDGKWLAYNRDESGVQDVYVQPFPPTGAKWKISQNGGILPRWRADGQEMFFVASGNVNGAGRLMAVPVDLASTVRTGVPQRLVAAPFVPSLANDYPYAVSPDGQRVLVIQPADDPNRSAISIVLNWTADLRTN